MGAGYVRPLRIGPAGQATLREGGCNPRSGMVYFLNPMTTLPKKYPTFLVKASWRATAIKFYVVAKNEDDAWNKASRMVKRMFGGLSCEEIKVLGTV